MKKKQIAAYVTAEDFVRIWQGSKSVSAIRETIRKQAGGMPTRAAVLGRARNYRRHGVPLQQFAPAGRCPADWTALAALAKVSAK